MVYRPFAALTAALFFSLAALSQGQTGDLLDKIYGPTAERPNAYTFEQVIHYDLVQRIAGGEGQPPRVIEGAMSLYFTPGDSAYGRVVETGETTLISIGDLSTGKRYSLSDLGVAKVGNESPISVRMADTLQMSRVSGDREIEGRMSAHYWHENGTRIDELWADSQANAQEVAIGRLWPQFEPGFQSLATGTYEGLATRWIAIDTEFSRDPRIVLQFKGVEVLDKPMEISMLGYVFPASESEMMRRRLDADRQ